MDRINVGRVLLGGLLAGLVMNISEFVLNSIVLGAQMKDFFTSHKFTDPAGSFIAIAVMLTFVLGVALVLLYAMIRPRFGPGPRTAIIAAVLVWFFIAVYTGILNNVLFGIPAGTAILVIVWVLVEYILGALVGAFVYKEAQP
ncbi:MAG: hypothetical protein QOJ88_890 [Pyrinomonadaceae bacterium]|jgi:hypothetical protein|nr:hypothetical protein [Pyrinomonadaceae bacterium]MDQ1728524.1 hypothetical protein [Pyrinomonadaceae bacterium]